MKLDYREYYYIESYLFDDVRRRFTEQGFLSAFDFFCIVIWKSNRAKSKIARRLLVHGHDDLEAAVHALTSGLTRQVTAREKLHYLWETWGLSLPMASAILTVLYPDEFTIYDTRVCDALGNYHRLANKTNFDNLWQGYVSFRQQVETSAPEGLPLRDKDRYLWGKSFCDQLMDDVERRFGIGQVNKA